MEARNFNEYPIEEFENLVASFNVTDFLQPNLGTKYSLQQRGEPNL